MSSVPAELRNEGKGLSDEKIGRDYRSALLGSIIIVCIVRIVCIIWDPPEIDINSEFRSWPSS